MKGSLTHYPDIKAYRERVSSSERKIRKEELPLKSTEPTKPVTEPDTKVEVSTEAKSMAQKQKLENIKDIPPKSGPPSPEMLKSPIVFFITGLRMFNWSSSQDGLKAMAQAVEGSRVYNWDQKSEMMDIIKKTEPSQPIILVGHSLGGDTAVEMANELNSKENNYRAVSLLGTIDSFGRNNDIIPANVKKNLNFIGADQGLLNDGPNAARNHLKTDVKNFVRDEEHQRIDNALEVQFELFKDISTILQPATGALIA